MAKSKHTSQVIKQLTEQIYETSNGLHKKDIKKTLQALWDIQCQQWLAEHKVVCAPVGYVYVKEIHKDFFVDFKTKERTPGDRTILKMRTQRTIKAADKWSEKFKDYYNEFYTR